MKIIDLTVTRGHVVLWLENGRYVFMDGELAMGQTFYVTRGRDWYWVGKPAEKFQFLESMNVLGTVSAAEKTQVTAAVEQFNKENDFRILFD